MIDSSVALNWVMPDEDGTLAEALMDSVSVTGAVIPALFQIEVGNTLLVGVRRRRIAAHYVQRALDLIRQLPLDMDRSSADYVWSTTIDLAAAYGLSLYDATYLELADLHGLTLYDATYLELALRSGLPLATLDKRLAKAAGDLGILLN